MGYLYEDMVNNEQDVFGEWQAFAFYNGILVLGKTIRSVWG